MSILAGIKRHLNKYRKYMFKYKNGFYLMPYMANSPQATVASFKSTPFIKWDGKRHRLQMKSPFMEGFAFCYEIEDGLWVYLNDVNYKANMEFKMYFDEEIPADYYLFSYNIIRHRSKHKIALVNGLSYKTFSWNLLKPKANFSLTCFKDTENCSLGIYMSETWLNTHLPAFKSYKGSTLHNFVNSPAQVALWSETHNPHNGFYHRFLNLFEQPDSPQKHQELELCAREYVAHLIQHYNNNIHSATSDEMSFYTKLLKVQNKLHDNLLREFPGIDELAHSIHVSPSTLKTGFKQYFDQSVYQYYLGKQMDHALTLIRDKKMNVMDVSKLLGYQSEGKFTIAFKEKFGYLPSKAKQAEESRGN